VTRAPNNLFGNRGFLRLWCAATVSNFGSMLSAVALPFVAVIWLDATPADMAGLAAAALVPGVVLGLFAGAFIDRLRRRPVLIVTDVGRALAVLSIPVAAWLDALVMPHLYLVAALNGLLSFAFGVAHLSYLPSLVERDQLTAANGRLAAGEAIAEGGAFASGGWLVEILTAPFALVIDSITFLVSALFLIGIRAEEPVRESTQRQPVLKDAAEGLRFVLRHPVLLPVVGSAVLSALGFQILGVVYILFVYDELGFRPGTLGMIFAVGAASSFVGALVSGRMTTVLGAGRTMSLGLALFAASTLLLPLAQGATLLAAAIVVLQQMGDGAEVLFRVNQVSLRQKLTSDEILGRVHASQRFLSSIAMLVGVALGGFLGEQFGLRVTLTTGGAAILLGAVWLALSPAWRQK
jgi:MFS family permease